VKPSNIFYTFDGDVKVFNFSFARFLSEEPPHAPPAAGRVMQRGGSRG
jgi:hypothetical protein